MEQMIYCIICVFALLINKVSLQAVNVAVGVTGGAVLLPCATSDIEHKLSDITVQWRHNDSLPVCAIKDGTFSLQDQDLTYKNRTETFPTEYEKGNFSIKLNNLACTDAGHYQCFILHSSEEVIIQLSIKESTVQIGEKPTEKNGNQARGTASTIIFAVLGVLILMCLVFCVLFVYKKSVKEGTIPCRDVFHDLHVKGNIEPHSNSTSVQENTFTRF